MSFDAHTMKTLANASIGFEENKIIGILKIKIEACAENGNYELYELGSISKNTKRHFENIGFVVEVTSSLCCGDSFYIKWD